MLSPETNSNWLKLELYTKVCGTCDFVCLSQFVTSASKNTLLLI